MTLEVSVMDVDRIEIQRFTAPDCFDLQNCARTRRTLLVRHKCSLSRRRQSAIYVQRFFIGKTCCVIYSRTTAVESKNNETENAAVKDLTFSMSDDIRYRRTRQQRRPCAANHLLTLQARKIPRGALKVPSIVSTRHPTESSPRLFIGRNESISAVVYQDDMRIDR
jgi:hypothetical protein